MTTEDRFWSKVDTSGGPDACWPWTASRHPFGYGWFRFNGQTMTAHRVALVLSGVSVGGLYACHTCDNPPCVNPRHLYAGSQKQNMGDAVSRGRTVGPAPRAGSANGWASLTDEQVLELRALHRQGIPAYNLGARFGISGTAAWRAITGRTYGNLPGAAPTRQYKARRAA